MRPRSDKAFSEVLDRDFNDSIPAHNTALWRLSLYLEPEGWGEYRQGVLWVEDDEGEEKLFVEHLFEIYEEVTTQKGLKEFLESQIFDCSFELEDAFFIGDTEECDYPDEDAFLEAIDYEKLIEMIKQCWSRACLSEELKIIRKAQKWKLEGLLLLAAIDYLLLDMDPPFEESEVAILTGYFYLNNNVKELLMSEFLQAKNDAKQKLDQLKEPDYIYINLINGRLCGLDPDHMGWVIVPKRCLFEKDNIYYPEEGWMDFTPENCIKNNFLYIDEANAEEEFQAMNHTEPMCIKEINCLLYLDSNNWEQVSDSDLLLENDIDPKDVDYKNSRWHDG